MRNTVVYMRLDVVDRDYFGPRSSRWNPSDWLNWPPTNPVTTTAVNTSSFEQHSLANTRLSKVDTNPSAIECDESTCELQANLL